MPVIIKELEIKTHIMSDQGRGFHRGPSGAMNDYENDFVDEEDYVQDNYQSTGRVEVEEIIQECTDRVLEILKQKNEW